MSALSPRPWRKRTFADGSRNIVSGPGGLGFVCQYSHKDEKDAEEAEADGTLIEAAPDLLEAARDTAREWRLHGQLTDSCRVLEAAIAKAEGRA